MITLVGIRSEALDDLTTTLLHRAYYATFRANRIKGSIDRMQAA